jgi:hypothetical protein
VLRGVTLAGCSAALAVAAHAAAGGVLPSAGLTVVLTAVLAGAGVALADRRRGLPAIFAVVAASQLAMHTLLSQAGHGHPAVDATVQMTVLHAAAAVLVAVLLAGAEGAVFTAVAVLRWLLSGVVLVPRPLPDVRLAPRLVAPVAAGSITLDVLLRRVHARRGPP